MRLRFDTALVQASPQPAHKSGRDVRGEYPGAVVTVQPRVVANTQGERQLAYFVHIERTEGEGASGWSLSPSRSALTLFLGREGFKVGQGRWTVEEGRLATPTMAELTEHEQSSPPRSAARELRAHKATADPSHAMKGGRTDGHEYATEEGSQSG